MKRVLKKNLKACDVCKNLKDVFHDNKDVKAMHLDNDLRNLSIGNLSITRYFTNIKDVSDLLANVEAPVSDKSLVTYVINGFGNKLDHVASIIRHRNTFPAFETARSMLFVKDSILNREIDANSLGSSSSPLVLLVTMEGNGEWSITLSTLTEEVWKVNRECLVAEIHAVKRKGRLIIFWLMAIPKEHMRRFHGMDDAKEIWEAIRTRFGGNANSKKMQKAVFKQQFEAFKISNSEGLEKGYDRFQQLLSQLEAHGAEVSTEDANHKFLRSLPSAWSNLAMTMRTNPEIDNLSIDDLYNNLRVFEQEIQGASKTSSSAQNVAFVSQSKSSTNKVKSGFSGAYSSCTPSTSSTNIPEKEVLAGFADEVIYSLFAKQTEDLDLLHEDLEQIDDVDIEEMDINWQIAMIAIRMKKFYKKTGRRVRVDGKTPVGFDKKKLECFNCHNTGHFARECTAKGTHDGKKKRDSLYQHQEAGKQEKNQMGLLTMDDGIVNWGEHTEAEETNHALMAISSSNEVSLCSKTCIDSYNKLKTLCDEQMNQLGDQEAQILAYSQAVKKLEAQLVTSQKQQLSLNEKLTFQANEIYEKDEKLKRYRRIGMKAVKEKEQLQKTVDSWKDSSKNLWRLINSGMSSNDKLGLGFEIQSNDEVLSYEEEMNFSVFKCSKEDSIGKPSYSRFTKTNDFKGVPHPLSGDYTPKPQEEIDDSLYVYGKKGPQKPEISVSDENSSEHSSCQSNDSEGSCGNISEHSFETESESVSEPSEVSKSSIEVTNEKDVSAPKSKEVEPSCVSHIKTPRQPLKDKETHKVNRKNWNDMMERELGEGYSFTKKKCFVCGSLNHLIKDCDYYEKKMAREAEVKRVVNTGNGMAKPVWTNANRINHANQFVPRSVQLNAGRPKFNTVRPNINTGRTNINSGRPKVNAVSPKVNSVRSKQPVTHKTSNSSSPKRPQMNQMNQRRDFSKSYSSVRRPFANSTAQMTNSNAVMGRWGSAVKTSASYNWRNTRPNFNYNSGPTFNRTEHPLKNMVDRGIFDSGCSGHMTGNKDQLEDFEEFNGGSVTFGGSKGYISGKGRIRVGNLDFDSVSLVKELGHFNLFSISQICDKQHKVLFTETECLVVSSDFKMPDENQILLKVPRHHNMYSFDMKTPSPAKGFACLIAKATSDESKLWHRRLGHINFKNLNKLVKGNLVRDLVGYSFWLLRMKLVAFFRPLLGIENQLSHRFKSLDLDIGTEFRLEISLEILLKPGINKSIILSYQPLFGQKQLVLLAIFLSGDSLEVTNSAGTSQTPKSIASEEKDEEVELIVVPSAVKIPEEKDESRTSSTNSKKEETLTEPQKKEEEGFPPDLFRRQILRFKLLEEIITGSQDSYFWWLIHDDSLMPELEIFHKPETGIFDEASYDEEGVITDFNSLPTEIEVSPTPTLRIHSIHPKSQILGDPKSAVQTRSKVQNKSGAHALLSHIQKQQRNNHKDQQHCLFACFLSQEEPKKIAEALQDDSWVQAMQEELLQFKLQQVWVLVDLPHGMKVIGTKWVYKNKRDEREVVVVEGIKKDWGPQGLLSGRCSRFQESPLTWKAFSCDSDLVGPTLIGKSQTGFAEIVDFLRGSNLRYALTSNPTIYDSLVKQFWQTATANTKADGSLEINATIDTIGYTITEASIRDSLQLEDATGITMLPNDELFGGMGQMGYPTDGTFTFWKSFFTPQWRYLVHHLLHCISSKSGGWDQFGSNIATALICLSTNRVYNFSKLIFDGMVANLKSKTQVFDCFSFSTNDFEYSIGTTKHLYLAVSLTKKIFGNMKRGFRGAPRPLLPAMLLVATNPNAGQEHDAVAPSQPSSSTPPVPSTSSPPLGNGSQTNQADNGKCYCEVSQESEESWWVFEKEIWFCQMQKKRNAAQGRKSQDDPLDSSVQGLVTPSSTKVNASGEEQVEDISPNTLEAAKTLSKVASLKPRSIDKGRRYKRRKEAKGKKVVSSLDFQEEVDTGAEQVNTAEGVSTGSTKLSTGSEQVSTVGDKKSTSSPDKGQRAGKAPMIIEETPKKSKEQVLQEEASLAEAIRLDTLQKEEVAKQVHLDSLLAQRIAEEEELNEQQKKRKAQVQFEAQHYTNEDWDLIRAKIEANAELSKSMLGSELQGEDFAKKMVDLVNQRKKYFAEERARAKRNKPMTQSQLKTYMMNYLKNQGTWKLSQLKNLSFEEVKKEFDKLVKQVESFAPINFEATKASLKRFGEELQTKTPKRLKDDEAKDDESTKKSGKRRKQMARRGLHTNIDKDDSEGSDEDSEQDDSVTGTKTPINPVPVAMKTPSIATYKIIKQGEKGAYQIVREDGTDVVYINFGAMLKVISRDDLTELYRIVMNRYGMDGPEDKLEKIFWKYLKNMFEEPLSTDPIWSELGQQRIISWRYYESCRVHCLNLESMDIYMLIERTYPLSAEMCK
ncbi:putative ribonuclease H-like domain-containing protein, partial [Tanacetum coccineum]